MDIKQADFDKKVRALERRRTTVEKRLLDSVSGFYDMKIMNIPPEILNLPLNQLTENDLAFSKNDDFPKIADDPREANNGLSELASLPKFRKPNTRSSRTDKYKTPARSIKRPLSTMVTPKFNPQSTMSVLRKPREGEIAMSMSGSPLHVTSVINERKPNAVIPLEDGKILSVLPGRGLRKSEIPVLDTVLKGQLKELYRNLNEILSLNQ
ncbi:hypothetical protein J437_LFUL019068 [Ladona fulva]|uniref:Borealin C-terminal domain-containing protein n=1 Tax=Ladona fulva TaxID=123851 RepID=A0A8K0KQQ9_LADFU|nr:hypothetical protein J437_LFUL019068 [Ladona fulva]